MRTIRTKKNLPFLIAALVLASCTTFDQPEPVLDPAAELIQAKVKDSVFLVGDAGERGARDQVLAALREDVSAASAKALDSSTELGK